MKIKNSNYRWIIDVILFIAFLLAFFLDLTGLTFHQLLGVFIGLFALYHLLIHWDWVQSVTARLFSQPPKRSHVNFVLDLGLLAGFVLIIGTGLVISSWFNLPLANYDTWLAFHIAVSLAALALLIVKIALHWRWIVLTARKIFRKSAVNPVSINRIPVPATPREMVSRREFLRVVLPVGALTLAAVSLAVKRLSLLTLDQDSEETSYVYAQDISDATTSATETADQTTAVTASAATPAQTTQMTPTPSVAAAPCTVRCSRGCSFPGRCRRYIDSNNNNRCDLGECL